MAKSIFVSYNFNDRTVSKAVQGMIQEHKEDIQGRVVFVENDVSYNGSTAIDWEIEHTMEDCDAALFVLGDQHHNSPWLNQEVNHALAKHIPIMVTSLPGESRDKPVSLTEDNCTTVTWDSGELYSGLNQA
jgi:hypothetical protein